MPPEQEEPTLKGSGTALPALVLTPLGSSAATGLHEPISATAAKYFPAQSSNVLQVVVAGTVLSRNLPHPGQDVTISAEGSVPVQVLVLAHSWGDNVFRNFLHWADDQEAGWTEKHIAHYGNLAGPVLGVPKAVTALLSGGLTLSRQSVNPELVMLARAEAIQLGPTSPLPGTSCRRDARHSRAGHAGGGHGQPLDPPSHPRQPVPHLGQPARHAAGGGPRHMGQRDLGS